MIRWSLGFLVGLRDSPASFLAHQSNISTTTLLLNHISYGFYLSELMSCLGLALTFLESSFTLTNYTGAHRQPIARLNRFIYRRYD